MSLSRFPRLLNSRNSVNLAQIWVPMLSPTLIGRSLKPDKLPNMSLRYNRRIRTRTSSRIPTYRLSHYTHNNWISGFKRIHNTGSLIVEHWSGRSRICGGLVERYDLRYGFFCYLSEAYGHSTQISVHPASDP